MSEIILVLGTSGSGKSYSLRNLDPKTSLLASVDGKRPPFSLKDWPKLDSKNPSGSFYVPQRADPYGTLKRAILSGVKAGKKTIVIDDSQFLLANDFFAKAHEKGYEKFTMMGQQFWTLIEFCRDLPEDVTVYFMHHQELDTFGNIQVKTIGKMLSEKGSVEGRFTICLVAQKADGHYGFYSNLTDQTIAKAPPNMFGSDPMDNDLKAIDDSIREYWNL